MEKLKPGWATTTVGMEIRERIWELWAKGETVANTSKILQGEIEAAEDNQTFDRKTISKVRDELKGVPIEILREVVAKKPVIRPLLADIRPDVLKELGNPPINRGKNADWKAPLLEKAMKEHHDGIQRQLALWQLIVHETNEVGVWGQVEEGLHKEDFDINGPLFQCMLQHCPSVNEKYGLLQKKRDQIEAETQELSKKIRVRNSDAFKSFADSVIRRALRKARGLGRPMYRIDKCGDEFSLNIDNDNNIALGSRDSMELFVEKHRSLVNEYAGTQKIIHILDLTKQLAKMHEELERVIDESQIQKEWISNDCDLCPGARASK